jgi:hypothetical protein
MKHIPSFNEFVNEGLNEATSDTTLFKVYFKPEFSYPDDATNTPLKPIFVQMNTGERTKIAAYTAIDKIEGYGKTTFDRLSPREYLGHTERTFAQLFTIVKSLQRVKFKK